MKNTPKIEVLKKAIHMLENGFEYNWKKTDQCNCGVVLRAAGLVPDDIIGGGSFDSRIKNSKGEKCHVTGLPFGKVQQVFLELGFTRNEILELEFLTNDKIAEAIGKKVNMFDTPFIQDNLYKDKNTLIQYLKAWVSILQESEIQPEIKERIVYVAVPTTITEKAKEWRFKPEFDSCTSMDEIAAEIREWFCEGTLRHTTRKIL